MKAKHLAKKLFGGITVKIKNGPLKGMNWSITSGNNFLSGNYENYKTKAVLKHLHNGMIYYDVGAHIGYYTAVASLAVGKTGKVYAFEPRPMNITFFKRHMNRNNILNVELTEAGVWNTTGKEFFDDNKGSATGKIDSKGNIEVQTVSIDEWQRQKDYPLPDFIKIDVEGAEWHVLDGARNTISNNRPVILVATHDDQKHRDVIQFLDEMNYSHSVLDLEGEKGETEVLAIPNPV